MLDSASAPALPVDPPSSSTDNNINHDVPKTTTSVEPSVPPHDAIPIPIPVPPPQISTTSVLESTAVVGKDSANTAAILEPTATPQDQSVSLSKPPTIIVSETITASESEPVTSKVTDNDNDHGNGNGNDNNKPSQTPTISVSETIAKSEPVTTSTNDDATATATATNEEVLKEDEEASDEEETFLLGIEEKQQQQLKVEEEIKVESLPSAASDAPLLLQSVVKAEVQMTTATKNSSATKMEVDDLDGGSEEEKKEDGERGNQLDFLLSKATEYSNFIAADLQELQNSMTETAMREEAAIQEEQERKRKGGKITTNSRKRSKKNPNGKSNGTTNLKKVQEKHAAKISTKHPIFIQPKNLAPDCVLKDYQLEGVRWLTSLFENGVSGILADEMGLGKTIQVISMIAHLKIMDVPGPFLVVAPLATLPNWVREFEKWLPSLPVCRYHGTAVEREEMLVNHLNPKQKRSVTFPVIVTSYEVAIKDERKLNKIGEYTYLVVDEGQRLKNHRCALIQSLKRIKAANRLLLSGTPIQNNLDELWSLLNFVNPAIFDDLSVFQSWFGFKNIGQKKKDSTNEESILVEQRKNRTVTKLHEILRPFLLRRIKTQVLTDMPPKKEVVVYAGMSKLQSGYAELIDRGIIRQILMSQGIEQARSLSQTNKQMNHRKNANHPFLFGEPIDADTGIHLGTAHPQLLVRASGKFALLDRMLSRLHVDGHQVLIFSQMTALLNVIEDYLVWRDWKYCRIDGSTKIDDRQRQMDVFNAEKTAGDEGGRNMRDDRHFVFLLSTRAGGLGINLATADTCIIFDSDWNPHQDSQAMVSLPDSIHAHTRTSLIFLRQVVNLH